MGKGGDVSGPCDDPNCDICRYIFYSVPEHKVPLGGATDTKIVYQTIPIDESADELVEALKKLEQAEAEVERLTPHQNCGSHWDGCWRAGGHHSCAIAEVERLNEFCYECKHLDGWAWCRESGLTEQREQRDHCLFTPSRWERRET